MVIDLIKNDIVFVRLRLKNDEVTSVYTNRMSTGVPPIGDRSMIDAQPEQYRYDGLGEGV